MAMLITIEGDNTEIVGAMTLFAGQNGWHSTIPNPDYMPDVPGSEEFIPNPVDALTYSTSVLVNYLRTTVKSYNVNLAVNAARQAAESASETALDRMTLSATLT